jgi:hypothetical protein
MKPLLFLAEKKLGNEILLNNVDLQNGRLARTNEPRTVTYSKTALALLSRLTYGYDKPDLKV